jgi:SdrD B-like domain/FG-GAP-like repeat
MARQNNSKPQVLALEDRSVPATLTGVVYSDINGSGTQDVGEPGLGGVLVQLDMGSTGGVDATAQTDSDGKYTFANVNTAQNTVNVMPSLGTTVVGATTAQITVRAGDTTTVVPAIGLRTQGRVAGTIFTDLNGNGKQDANDPGFVGALVSIDLNNDGTNELNTTSGDGGAFTFSNLPDGVHSVSVNLPTNYKASTPTTSLVTITNGSVATSLVVGVKPSSGVTGKITLGGSTNSTGVQGVTVGLDTNADGKADMTTTTNEDGVYVFTNVAPGTQTLVVTAPAGSRYSTPDGTNKLAVNVTANPSGGSNIATGVDVAITYPGTVVGSVYVDANTNGKLDEGERNVAPGTVQIDLNGSGKLITVNAISQADGTFRVEGLPDGKHFLVVSPSGGFTATTFSRLPFTIKDGSVVTVVALGVKGGGIGSTLNIGNASGGDSKSYTFVKNADGTLTPTVSRTITGPATQQTGTRVLTTDFNGDGTDDTITATGGGASARIYVYDGKDGDELVAGGFSAFEAGFTGGVNLAAGDFNGDGKSDIVAAADVGGGPRVRIFNAAQFQSGADPAQGKLLADFFGIEDTKFRGGARVAVGDLNKDGTPDLVVSAGVGGGPRVAIYNGASVITGAAKPEKLVADFFAYETKLRNGAVVSLGDVNGDGTLDLITGAGSGGAPRVTVFSGNGIMMNQGANSTRIADYYVNGDVTSRSGTNLTVKDLDSDGRADVVATTGTTAYVFTSTSISNNFLNPSTTGPKASATIDGFTDSNSVNVG